jgi:hypothetical protein
MSRLAEEETFLAYIWAKCYCNLDPTHQASCRFSWLFSALIPTQYLKSGHNHFLFNTLFTNNHLPDTIQSLSSVRVVE